MSRDVMAALSRTLLVDNGSLQPAAIKKLRGLAWELSQRLGETVDSVSVLHSDKIPAEEIDGVPAETLEAALRRRLAAGLTQFKIIPLFIGPSGAITSGLGELVAKLRNTWPALTVRVAPWLGQGDELADVLADHVRTVQTGNEVRVDEPANGERETRLGDSDGLPRRSGPRHDKPHKVRVALVDHGSPTREVTAVRDRLADALAGRLGAEVEAVAPCSMERRAGESYAFNEPLLENLLLTAEWREANVVVAMLFLLPGRHAGPSGDIAMMCERAKAKAPKLKIRITPLLADHPDLIGLLAKAAAAAEDRR